MIQDTLRFKVKKKLTNEQIKEKCPLKPDNFTLCYNTVKNIYCYYYEGLWYEDKGFEENTLPLGTIRKIGKVYYIYDGESEWQEFGVVIPENGSVFQIRGSYYIYQNGNPEKLYNNEQCDEQCFDVLKKLCRDYVLKYYVSWEKFYNDWVNGFHNGFLIREGCRILEKHIGVMSYLNYIKDGFDENLKKQVDNCAVGSDPDPFELDRVLLNISEEKELAMLSGFCEGVGCIAKYVYSYSKELGEYLKSHCYINDCSDCVKIFFDLVK